MNKYDQYEPKMKTGCIFDIKRYAIHDGPGIRSTVFMKGCPLRCNWCHNPEGQNPKPELIFKENRCINGCDECIASCPKRALSQENHSIFINRKKCDLCGDCVEICPTVSLEIIGREVFAEEVLQEIEKDLVFYEESTGGVTFSGGEPLMQPEFLHLLLEGCKKKNIHTTVDTSGYASFDFFDRIANEVDLFLYDLKMIDNEKHKKWTGVSNNLILENLKKLSTKSNNIVIRIPLIPGINDTKNNIIQTAEFLAPLQGIKYIGLLPYHRIGKQKYQRLNFPFLMKNVQPPSDERTKEIKKHLKGLGFMVKTGEYSNE